jgi:uncharacterized protein (DUF983 family)
MSKKEQKPELSTEKALHIADVSCLICPGCGNSDKYVKYYHADMICLGCGYDLGQICS